MKPRPGNEDNISPIPVVINMALIAGFALLFNIYPEKVGVWRSAIDPDSFTPLLGSGYRIYLPALNLWWGLTFTLNAVHFFVRRWTPVTRWVGAAINVYMVILLVWIALGPANFFTISTMLWLRPILGLVGLVILLRAFWQVRFVFPRLATS